jgi:hypothetical protein
VSTLTLTLVHSYAARFAEAGIHNTRISTDPKDRQGRLSRLVGADQLPVMGCTSRWGQLRCIDGLIDGSESTRVFARADADVREIRFVRGTETCDTRPGVQEPSRYLTGHLMAYFSLIYT